MRLNVSTLGVILRHNCTEETTLNLSLPLSVACVLFAAEKVPSALAVHFAVVHPLQPSADLAEEIGAPTKCGCGSQLVAK